MTNDELLQLITTDVLYEELLSRFEVVIISGLKKRPEEDDPDSRVLSWRWKGDPYVCQGLANGIISNVQSFLDETKERIDPRDL